MKTLVIHPLDPTTTFLNNIYKNIEDNFRPIHRTAKFQIHNLIPEYERVIMMGHGCPDGLFAIGQFRFNSHLIIDLWNVYHLSEQNQNIYIWCNADQFVDKYELKGFYTGMFISEVAEATFCKIPNPTQQMVDDSNQTFVEIVSKYINEPVQTIYDKVKEEYGVLAKINPVAKYNHQRLYVRV